MRILEYCAPSANPEVQVQISSLREAFSQDTSRAFELKPTLGLRSPSIENQPTPPGGQQIHGGLGQPPTAWNHMQDASSSKALGQSSEYTPPYDTTPTQATMPFVSSSFSGPNQAAYAPQSIGQVTSAPGQGYGLEHEQTAPVWDPSGIFQQWNTAFGAQGPAQPQPPPSSDPRMFPTSAPIPPHPQQSPPPHPIFGSQQGASTGNMAVPDPMSGLPTVTPVMWQDAFTNAYVSGHGHKRYREESLEPAPYDQYSKRRG